MAESDGPKFKCAACGREFRWKPELAGKKAKCKCGATVTVPTAAPAPAAVEHDPFEMAGEPEPVAPPPQFRPAPVPAPVGGPPQQTACPACGAAALPTALLCTSCGYNFRTGQRMPGAGRGVVARGAPAGGIAADTYQQAAKFSWMAPLVAILLGCCTVGVRKAGPGVSLGIAGLQLLLILGGLGAGIFALFGAKRYGSSGIVAPAVTGIILNTLIIGLNVVLLTMLLSGKFPMPNAAGGTGGSGTAAPPRTRQQVQQQGEDAVMKEAGWVGVLQHRGAAITLVTVPDSTPVAAEMLGNLKTPVSLLVVGVDNSRGGDSFSLDPAGSTVTLADGTTQELPDVVTVLRSARSDRAQFVRQFSPPFEVMPGRQLVGKFMFLPRGTDASKIASVSVKIDGQPVEVTGRFMTAEEKQSAAAAGGR